MPQPEGFGQYTHTLHPGDSSACATHASWHASAESSKKSEPHFTTSPAYSACSMGRNARGSVEEEDEDEVEVEVEDEVEDEVDVEIDFESPSRSSAELDFVDDVVDVEDVDADEARLAARCFVWPNPRWWLSRVGVPPSAWLAWNAAATAALADALSRIARSALASASRIGSALAVVAVRGSSRRTCGRRPSW